MTTWAERDEWALRLLDELDRAAVPVRRDLARTYGAEVEVAAVIGDLDDPVLLVDGSGGSAFVSLDDLPAVARAAVADFVQGELMDENASKFWPVCREHERGLHAEVRDAEAVWWCRGGPHVVSVIGHLEPTQII